MTIDNEGNVYLTGKGVTVFDKTGKQIEQIPIAEDWTGNICFGGKDRHTLFITASKSLYGHANARQRRRQPVEREVLSGRNRQRRAGVHKAVFGGGVLAQGFKGQGVSEIVALPYVTPPDAAPASIAGAFRCLLLSRPGAWPATASR